MVVVPPALPTASPAFGVIVALVGSDEVQATELLMSCEDPSLYCAVAVICWLDPTKTVAGFGPTVIETRVVFTVTVAVPNTPPEAALMFAVPLLTPVTSPPGLLTAAMVGMEEVQFAVLVMSCVDPSLRVAIASICRLVFTETVPGFGVTMIEVIEGVMVTEAIPVTPFSVAVITAAPAATPVTLPMASTVATLGAEDVQDTLEPRVRELPSL